MLFDGTGIICCLMVLELYVVFGIGIICCCCQLELCCVN